MCSSDLTLTTLVTVALQGTQAVTAGSATTLAGTAATAYSITKCTLCNTDTSARLVDLYIRPDSSTATAKDAVRLSIPLAAKGSAGDTYTMPEMVGRSLPTGWTIQGKADAASKVAIVIEAALVT